jgi:hypothetical protein
MECLRVPPLYFFVLVYFVVQELLTLPEHMSSPPGFSEVRVTRSLVLCVMFCRSLFVLFPLTIVLSILFFDLRFLIVTFVSPSSSYIINNLKKSICDGI